MAVRPISETRNLPALIPGVKHKTWRRDDIYSPERAREYSLVRKAVFDRDGYTCQWCNFSTVGDSNASPNNLVSSGYMEVHPINDENPNSNNENLATICPFCHAVFHIGFTGHHKQAKIVRIPWLSQADLNLLVNCLAVATIRGGVEIPEDADNLLVWLNAFEGPAIRKYGEAVINPTFLASALLGLLKKNPKLYEHRNRALYDLRVLPDPLQFQDAIHWFSKHSWTAGENWEVTWQAVYKQWLDNNQKKLVEVTKEQG